MIILRENNEQLFDTLLQKLKEDYDSLDSHKVLYATVDALNNYLDLDQTEDFYNKFSSYVNDQVGSLLMVLTPDEMTGLCLAFEMSKFSSPDELDGMEALLNATRRQEHGIVSQDIQTNSF